MTVTITKKPEKLSQKLKKIQKFDQKDRQIMNILMLNSRATLKSIGKQIGLSIDATKSRLDKLKKSAIDRFTLSPLPQAFGLNLGVHVYIKLNNVDNSKLENFISKMKTKSRVINLMSMMGDYDIYIVLLAKNSIEYNKMKNEIRNEFKDIISEWKEVIVGEIHKLEIYKF
jgi:Lrp/AsnC family transcriptional regulator, leucine-responsive regulatory protein